MGSLKKCLDKVKLGAHERAIINGKVEDAAAEGYPPYKAAKEAVKEYLQEIEDDLGDIDKQVDAKLEQDYQGSGQTKFAQWFGKSKVVDSAGRPRIVYHGTTAPVDFDAFDTEPSPTNYDDPDSIPRAAGDDPTTFVGAHFAETPRVANLFAAGIYQRRGMPETGRVYPVYLSIERPLNISERDMQNQIKSMPLTTQYLEEFVESFSDDELVNQYSNYDVKDVEDFWNKYDESGDFRLEVNNDLIKWATDTFDDSMGVREEIAHNAATAWREDVIDDGFDGIEYDNETEGGTAWIAFYPWQIKSQFNLAPDKDRDEMLASVKRERPDEGYLKELPKDVVAQIRKDAPLNPKVADLVVGLNKAGFKTILSGDMYGDRLVYVDLEESLDNEHLLFLATRAGTGWPDGWKAMVRDINVTENRVLGTPIDPAQRSAINHREAYLAHTRMAKAGVSVSADEVAGIVGALQAAKKKATGKPAFSVKIPALTTTQEAYEFGLKATPEQVSIMRTMREEYLAAVNEMRLRDYISDEDFDRMPAMAYQAQLLREAIESSEGKFTPAFVATAAWVNRTGDEEGRFSVKNTQPWRFDFPKAVIHTTVKAVQRHPNYRNGKYGENIEAARGVAAGLVDVERAKKLAEKYPSAILVPIIETEKPHNKVNLIPMAHAFRIAEVTGLKVTTDIFSSTLDRRINSKDRLARLIFRPIVEGAVAPNQTYILVDDVIDTGTGVSEYRHFIENAGGNVVAVTALAAQRNATQIAPKEATLGKLRAIKDQDQNGIAKALATYDITGALEALTEGEAKVLAQFENVESLHRSIHDRLDRERGISPVQAPKTSLIDEGDTTLEPAGQLKLDFSLPPAEDRKQFELSGVHQKVRMTTTGNIAAAGNVVLNYADVASLLAGIRKSAQELAYLVAVGSDGTVLQVQKFSKGLKASAPLHLVEMVGSAIREPGVDTVYFAHNHPTGSTTPSPEDIRSFEKLRGFFDMADVRFRPLIIAGTTYSGMTDPIPEKIRPTVRKVNLPVKERFLVRPIKEDDRPKFTFQADIEEYVRAKGYAGQTGVLLVDNHNRPSGYLKLEPGSGKRAFVELTKAAEFTNAGAAFLIIGPNGNTQETKAWSRAMSAVISDSLQIFDVVVEGKCASNSNTFSNWVERLTPSQDVEVAFERLGSSVLAANDMKARFSVRRKDINRAIERGLFNESDLAIAKDMEELSILDNELELTRTGNPQGNAIAISNRIRNEKPYIYDRIKAIEKRTMVPLLDLDGNLLMTPMEAKTVANIPGPTASQFYPIGGQRPWLIGALRTLTQTYLDNMDAERREHFRAAMVRSIEMAFTGEVQAERGEFGAGIKTLAARKDFYLARPLKRAKKTYAALNVNTMCPMMMLGSHGCYLDGCYVVGLAVSGHAINFYRSAMYTGEILQMSNRDLMALKRAGGLRVNGMGDLSWAERFQLADIVRHAKMRKLPIKIITKQDDTIKIVQWMINNNVPGAKSVRVQTSIDPYWVEVTRVDNLPGSAMKALQVVDMIKAGKLEPAAKFIRDHLGRDAKVINGKVFRKYGYSFKQLKELSKKYPDVRILPRVVVSTAKEISEYALRAPEVLQTWMHAVLRPGMWSEVEGRDLSEVALNFRYPIAIRKIDGEWRILRGTEKGTAEVGEGTDYKAVEDYIKSNYSKPDQEKIFNTLSGHLGRDSSSLCCAVGASVDACMDCQSSCNHGTYYTGAELREIATRGVKELAGAVEAIGKRDIIASVRRPVWYSPMAQFLERPGQLPARATSETFKQLLNGWAASGKFKAEELFWSGIPNTLDDIPADRELTKGVIIDAAKRYGVQLREVINTEDEERPENRYQRELTHLNAEIHKLVRKKIANEEKLVNILMGARADGSEGLPEENARDIVQMAAYPDSFMEHEREEAWKTLETFKTEFDFNSVYDNAKDLSKLEDDLAYLKEMNITEYASARYGPDSHGGRKLNIPGGKDYREILLIQKSPAERAGIDPSEEGSAMASRDVNREFGMRLGQPTTFMGSHWDEPNVLAHVRFDTRYKSMYTEAEAIEIGKRIAKVVNAKDSNSLGSGAPGRAVKAGAINEKEAQIYSHYRGFLGARTDLAIQKILFLQEIQSDWHEEAFRQRKQEVRRVAQERGISIKEALKLVPRDFGYIKFDSDAIKAKKVEVAAAEKKIASILNVNREKVLKDAALVGVSKERAEKIVLNKISDEQLARAGDVFDEWYGAYKEKVRLEEELYNLKYGVDSEAVPNAPFKTSWPALALKRMVRYAAENGYDVVAWTTGAMQADRYDLTKEVSEIKWNKWDADKKILVITPIRGNVIEMLIHPNGVVTGVGGGSIGNDMDGHDIHEIVGKEIGDKIMDQEYAILSGEGLKVGGTGMLGFYDQILVNEANALFNKKGWGYAKAGPVAISTDDLTDGQFELLDTQWLDEDGNLVVHGIPVTPAMKEASDQGMPLFSIRRTANSRFFSQLLDAVSDNKKGLPARALPDQMLATLQKMQKTGRFKKEEYDWVGLDDFLKSLPVNEKVTREQIIGHVELNTVPVTEYILGSRGIDPAAYGMVFNAFTAKWEVGFEHSGIFREDEEQGNYDIVDHQIGSVPNPLDPAKARNIALVQREYNDTPEKSGWYVIVEHIFYDPVTRAQKITKEQEGPFTGSHGELNARNWVQANIVDQIHGIHAISGGTVYEGYRISGQLGQNYRELLLRWSRHDFFRAIGHQLHRQIESLLSSKLPSEDVGMLLRPSAVSDNNRILDLREADQKLLEEKLGEKDFNRYAMLVSQWDAAVKSEEAHREYKGAHFSANLDVQCWIRFDERLDEEGRRILFINEIQSDWHQHGRRQGFAEAKDITGKVILAEPDAFGSGKPSYALKLYDMDGEFITAYTGYLNEAQAWSDFEDYRKGQALHYVPHTPYQGTWPLLALKRMVLYAAENGFDRIAWTSGATQYDKWGSERFAWSKVYYGGKTPGDVIPEISEAVKLFDKNVPLVFREYNVSPLAYDDEADLYQIRSARDLGAFMRRANDGEGQIVVGLIRNNKIHPHDAWRFDAREQFEGEAFGVVDQEALEVEMEKVTDFVFSEEHLREHVRKIFARQSHQYSPARFTKKVNRIAERIYTRMLEEDVGVELPRLIGMQAFYDRELVNMAKDFFGRKIWGGNVPYRLGVHTGFEPRHLDDEPLELPEMTFEEGVQFLEEMTQDELAPHDPAEDMAYMNKAYSAEWALDISDEIKMASLERGLPSFSVKRLDPTSRFFMDAMKAAGGGPSVTTPEDSAADPYAGLDDEVKKAMTASKGIPVPGFIEKGLAGAKEVWREMTRHRPFLDATQYADVADILRTHQDTPENSVRRAMTAISSIIGGLKPKQYEIFSLSLIMDDMLRDIDNGLLSEKEMLPFGFTKDSAAKYQAYLTSLVSYDPAISDALRRRQEFQNHLKQSLVSAELLNESVLEDERYWHHQVLQYRAIKDMGEVYRGIGVSSDDIRLKKKGWQRKRSGSVMDYNTQYVEAEFEWVAQALAQLETRVIMDAIREKTDITKTLKALAKKRNLENFYAPILAGLPDGTTIEDIRGSDIDPLAGYGKSVARAVMALGRMASKNELHAGAEYEETIEALADWFQDEKERKAELEENYRFQMPNLMEEGGLFALLSHLMANDLPGAPWAGSVFKAVRGRANEIKKTLGDKYLTPKRLIKTDPEFADYTEWIPSPGQTWYKAWSIPDRLVAQVQAGEDVIDQEKIQKAQQILARGRDATWIVPNGIAKTLDGYDSQKSDSRIGRGLAAIQAAWKQWTLINPFRVVKYNLNNMSGDLDITFAYRPKIVSHYLPKAIADLYRDWKDLNMNQGLKDELDLAYALGVLGSGWSVQEVSDVAAQLKFKKHLEALSGDDPGLVIKILSAPKKVWRGMQGFTQYRENLLRFAAFRYFMDELQKGNRVYGASNWKEIDAMDPLEIDRKAAKMARELLGDYGNVTHAGQWLRRHIIPFYSWMEVNAPRYVRLMKNLRHEGQGTGSRGARMVGVVAGPAAWKTSKLALKMAGFYALAILWNRFIFPDEDDEMGEQQRRQLHLILGRRDDGSIVSIRIQGAFSDALSWFGMEDFPTDIANLISGKKGITDVAKDSALAAPTKIINSLGPQWKAPGEIISGRSFYPDPLNPMPIRDRYEYLARTMSLGSVYDWLMGRPKRGGQLGGMMIEELMAMALYKSDPGEMAYYDTTRMVREYNERRGKEMPSGDPTSKSNALYYYRKSLKVGDLTAAEKYLREYYSFPGTNEKSLAKSIDRSHPLGGLAKKDRPEFLKSLTPEELEAYRIALSWYNQTYKGAAHAEAKAAAKRPIVDDDEEESTSTLRFNR